MKNICLFFILACFFPLAAQAEQPLKNNEAFVVAKAVKLGRGNAYSTGGLNSLRPETSLAKDCDPNCLSCDQTTGVCSKCKSGRYLKNNLCMVCPDNAVCPGDSSFSCDTSYRKAGETCLGMCSDVSCKTGFSTVIKSDRCCCG